METAKQHLRKAFDVGYCAPGRQLNVHPLVPPNLLMICKITAGTFFDLDTYNNYIKTIVKFPAIVKSDGDRSAFGQQSQRHGSYVRQADHSVAAATIRGRTLQAREQQKRWKERQDGDVFSSRRSGERRHVAAAEGHGATITSPTTASSTKRRQPRGRHRWTV